MNDKIIELHPRTAYEDINFYLDGLEAENTVTRYRKAIERFISKQYDGIPLQHVQESHFNDLTYTDMYRYRNYLRRKGYAASTVNNEMTALFNLLKELNKIQREDGSYPYSLNVDQLRTKTLRVREVNSSGDITWEEVDDWISYIQESDMANKNNKWIFLHIARITALRKEALANLIYRDIRKSGDTWQIKSTLKGKTTTVSIKNEDADLLFSLWKNRDDKNEKVFKLSTKTMERTFNEIKNVFNIPEERNVTIHSLKGLSIYESYLASGKNILVAQKHGNHSSLETTYGYVKSREDNSIQPSLYMGKTFNDDCIEGITDDQWKSIFNKLSRSAKYEIINTAKELGYSQE